MRRQALQFRFRSCPGSAWGRLGVGALLHPGSESPSRLSVALLLVFTQLTLRRKGLAAFVALLLISLWHNFHLLSAEWCTGVVFGAAC